MIPEEKILYKLRKFMVAIHVWWLSSSIRLGKKRKGFLKHLRKFSLRSHLKLLMSHDPEILTPKEHFYFLKMGKKCKNYVPVGRRGIYQGLILNMHLHWEKRQTLKVIVKTFSPEEVKEISAELARLSGGIVLDIQEGNTFIPWEELLSASNCDNVSQVNSFYEEGFG